jgi:hypothetical protein
MLQNTKKYKLITLLGLKTFILRPHRSGRADFEYVRLALLRISIEDSHQSCILRPIFEIPRRRFLLQILLTFHIDLLLD